MNKQLFTYERVVSGLRAAAPTLLVLALSTAAHAQGTIDFTRATTLMGTFKTFAEYAGAVSLASTRQMRDFLDKIAPQDRVLVIGDTRQHQGVDAGKPFEQMQDAGMRTAQLDKIVRQRDPELLGAVEKLSQNETAAGVAMLQQQGRVRQIDDRQERIAEIAKELCSQAGEHDYCLA